MKFISFSTYFVAFLLAANTTAEAHSALSDTAATLSDSGTHKYASSRTSAANDDLIAKRRNAINASGNKIETCESRKAKAMEQREQLKIDGVAEKSPELRKLNRQITFLNARCPEFKQTTNVISSICEARETALLHKLQQLKDSGASATNEELVTTEQELEQIRKRCAKKSFE